jgi:hypothetical protein
MESILISFVSLVLIIVTTVTLTMNTVSSTAKLSESWKVMQQKGSSLSRTAIVCYSGQVNINDFADWDVIIQGQDSGANSLTYSATYPPENNRWAIKGILMADNVPEVFDLNILNPSEQVVVGINPGGLIVEGKTVKITLATAEGVTSQCFVTEKAP